MKLVFPALLVLASAALLVACGEKKPAVSIFPLVTKEEIARGAAIYKSRCQACHGPVDKGNPPSIKPILLKPSLSGDAQQLASLILFSKQHQLPDGSYLFAELSDADIACVGNYLRDKVGAADKPLRSKTVERAREVHELESGH
jgi:mono/diheme cytochrome c family protein